MLKTRYLLQRKGKNRKGFKGVPQKSENQNIGSFVSADGGASSVNIVNNEPANTEVTNELTNAVNSLPAQTTMTINNIIATPFDRRDDSHIAAHPTNELSSSSTHVAPTYQNLKTSTRVKYKPITNKSEKKIRRNSLFNSKFTAQTHLQARKLGIKRISNNSKIKAQKGYKLIDSESLENAIMYSAICRFCKSPKSKLLLSEERGKRKGMCERLSLVCGICKEATSFETSKKASNKAFNAYDVNVRATFASQTMGRSRSGLEKFCAVMDVVPPIRKTPYVKIQNFLSKNAKEKALQTMKTSAANLIKETLEIDLDSIGFFSDGQMYANVAVTVDGMWQKRGHSSKVGVVFVISVLTGEVLDYETVLNFNTGAAAKADILLLTGVSVGPNLLSGLRMEDQKRIENATQKTSIKSRMTRRKRRANKRSKNDGAANEKVTYMAGAFGIAKEPELDVPLINSNEINIFELKFVDETCDVPSW